MRGALRLLPRDDAGPRGYFGCGDDVSPWSEAANSRRRRWGAAGPSFVQALGSPRTQRLQSNVRPGDCRWFTQADSEKPAAAT